MNIYLIRHGEAEPPSDNKPHEERILTANGIEILKTSLIFWKHYIDHFDIILTSPLKRAKQTAQIINNEFKAEFEVVEEICLLNGGMTDDLLSIARSLNLNEIAMVGHQPDIADHIAAMTGSKEAHYKIPAGTIVKINFKEKINVGKGVLEFLIPPQNKKG